MTDRLAGMSLRAMLFVADAPRGEYVYMSQIIAALDTQSCNLVPVMRRLLRNEWVEDRWEDGTTEELGRSRRRYFRATPAGRARLDRAKLSDIRAARAKLEPTGAALLHSEVRDRLTKTRQYWTGADGLASANALASEVLRLLAEHGVPVFDDNWQT